MTLESFSLDSPIGRLRATVGDGAVAVLDLPNGTRVTVPPAAPLSAPTRRVRERLACYFRGELDALDDVPVAPPGGTMFQRRVWLALRAIPVGSTICYRELAARVGAARAYRAVGSANGANPIPLVLPCHRVIAADGSLGGYGGGLDVKRWLLRHEGAPVHDLTASASRRDPVSRAAPGPTRPCPPGGRAARA